MTEMVDKKIDGKYRKAAQVINSAGGTPYPITDTLIEILKRLVTEEYLDFIMAFEKQRSQTMEQLKTSSNLSEEKILKNVEVLAKKGLIFNQPNRYGVMVFRLLPFVNVGAFEYIFMKKIGYTEEEKELADLFHKLDEEVSDLIQADYDAYVGTIDKSPPVDRTIPPSEIEIIVDNELEVPTEHVIPTRKVEELIEKFDDIAVGHCFCRHHKDILGASCKQTDIRENCFTFGKSARYTSEQGFARKISKDEASNILKEAEEAGLVHKAYYPNLDQSKDETSICNCCSCCCPNSRGNSIYAIVNATNYLAMIDQDLCSGCGTCVEKCHNKIITLNDEEKAERNAEFCIGCGVCAYFCPEDAISLVEKPRIIRIPPVRAK